ncbi:MAG: hypothetical protein MZV63_71215 [Marinilabiliales bacterium]|nr:hypothetical protein [Marinilabiliales bacterium]
MTFTINVHLNEKIVKNIDLSRYGEISRDPHPCDYRLHRDVMTISSV